jgi:hypothetical protein
VLHTFNGDDGDRVSGPFAASFRTFTAQLQSEAHTDRAIFSLKHIPGQWQLTLYSFKGQPDAGFPYGGLTFDQAGNLYGTTLRGANDFGSVY